MTSRHTVFSEIEFVITSRVLPEKLTGRQLVKKFPHFMEPENLLTHAQALVTCPYREPAHSSLCALSPFLNINFHFIFPSTPGSSSGLFPSGFHTKTLYAALHACCMARPTRFYRPNNIWWAVQVIKLHIMQFSPLPSSLLGPNICLGTLRSSLILSD